MDRQIFSDSRGDQDEERKEKRAQHRRKGEWPTKDGSVEIKT
jgi:hypothetical protein